MNNEVTSKQVRRRKQMRKISVMKRFTFEAAHHLLEYEGPCQYQHGHSYIVEVFVTGERNDCGMVMDFGILKKTMNELIIDKLDHKDLNNVLPFNTTAENMAFWMLSTLLNEINMKKTGCEVWKVQLWETANSCAIAEI